MSNCLYALFAEIGEKNCCTLLAVRDHGTSSENAVVLSM